MKYALAFLALVLASCGASAQGLVGMEKQILPMTKQNWIAFRNFGGQQLVYFTHLVVYRCGLAEIRYSISSDDLDQRFAMPPCEPERPNAIPSDFLPFVSLPPGTADSVTVQVVYADGEESEALRFMPCDIGDDGTCAQLAE